LELEPREEGVREQRDRARTERGTNYRELKIFRPKFWDENFIPKNLFPESGKTKNISLSFFLSLSPPLSLFSLFLSLYICLSVCTYVCLSTTSVCLCMSLSVSVCLCLSLVVSICLLFVHLFVRVSFISLFFSSQIALFDRKFVILLVPEIRDEKGNFL
jgi:hypothetical protein